MKKLSLSFALILLSAGFARAHTILGDASTLTRGTLSNSRLDPSVSLLGQTIEPSELGGSVAQRTGGIFTLYVGTPGTPGVDAYIGSNASFMAVMSSVGAQANYTALSTVTARIFFADGTYAISGVTVPAGIECIGASSTVWVNTGLAAANWIKLFGSPGREGRLKNIIFDDAGLAFRAQQIIVTSNTIIEDCQFTGFQSHVGAVLDTSIISIFNATNVRIRRNKFRDAFGAIGAARYGDCSPVIIKNSSNVWFYENEWRTSGETSNQGTHFGILSSTDIHVIDNQFYGLGGNGVAWSDGCVNIFAERNHFNGLRIGCDQGIIMAGSDTGAVMGNSTMSVISGNSFYSEPSITCNIISVTATSAKPTSGLLISNNHLTVPGANTVTFISLGGGARNPVLVGNTAQMGTGGTGLTDSSVGILKTGNAKNGIAF